MRFNENKKKIVFERARGKAIRLWTLYTAQATVLPRDLTQTKDLFHFLHDSRICLVSCDFCTDEGSVPFPAFTQKLFSKLKNEGAVMFPALTKNMLTFLYM